MICFYFQAAARRFIVLILYTHVWYLRTIVLGCPKTMLQTMSRVV